MKRWMMTQFSRGSIDRTFGAALMAAACMMPAGAATAPKIPADAPICAAPGAATLFLSPMGEPFRAPAGAAYPAATWFAGADANHDGAIDRAEMLADARRFFATLDHDHDGRLTPEEVIAYERDVAPEIAIYVARGVPGAPNAIDDRQASSPSRLRLPSSSRSGEAYYAGPMGAGRYAWLNIPQPVASADADINRLVDAAEFQAAAGRRFDALDKAARGRLRLADLPQTPTQQAAEGPCKPRPVRRANDREGAAR